MQQNQIKEVLPGFKKAINPINLAPRNKHQEPESTRKDLSESTEDSKGSIPFEISDSMGANSPSDRPSSEAEKFTETLIRSNDQAVALIQKGKCKDALIILEKVEQILETAAIKGSGLDRNLVIVVLYNIASSYQAMWSLEKCSKYTDGVIFNLVESLKHDEANYNKLVQKKSSIKELHLCQSIRLKKMHFLIKVYLQHCAVLSQLSRHEDSREMIDTGAKLLQKVIEIVLECCEQLKKITFQKLNESNSEKRPPSAMSQNKHAESSKNDAGYLLKEEVHYNYGLLEFAVPFLQDFLKMFGNPASQMQNLQNLKKFVFVWKNNPNNNEKYLREKLQKNVLSLELSGARTLLGVQQESEWLQNFNIGTVMHMNPLSYKDYIARRDVIAEVTKEALQEKVIYLSLVLFTTATEMRFLEVSPKDDGEKPEEEAPTKTLPVANERMKQSELYHLQAIEIVCKYITGPCPYVNHLISSYQKHYCQNLETILEESVLSSDSRSVCKGNAAENEEIHIINELLAESQRKPDVSTPAQTTKEKPKNELNPELNNSPVFNHISKTAAKIDKASIPKKEEVGRSYSEKSLVNVYTPRENSKGAAETEKSEKNKPNLFEIQKSYEQLLARTMTDSKTFSTNKNAAGNAVSMRPGRNLNFREKNDETPVTLEKGDRFNPVEGRRATDFYIKRDFQNPSRAIVKPYHFSQKATNKTVAVIKNQANFSNLDMSPRNCDSERQDSFNNLQNRSNSVQEQVSDNSRARSAAEKNRKIKLLADPPKVKPMKDTSFKINQNFQKFLQNIYQRDTSPPESKLKSPQSVSKPQSQLSNRSAVNIRSFEDRNTTKTPKGDQKLTELLHKLTIMDGKSQNKSETMKIDLHKQMIPRKDSKAAPPKANLTTDLSLHPTSPMQTSKALQQDKNLSSSANNFPLSLDIAKLKMLAQIQKAESENYRNKSGRRK